LPLPFGPTKPTFMPAVRTKLSPVNNRRGSCLALDSSGASLAGTSQATSVNSTRRLVLRWLASKSMPAELTVVRASMAFNWPIISLAESMRALDFVVRALGPRRSHSISVFTWLRRLSCWRLWVSR
jgi:hypothetical protein